MYMKSQYNSKGPQGTVAYSQKCWCQSLLQLVQQPNIEQKETETLSGPNLKTSLLTYNVRTTKSVY